MTNKKRVILIAALSFGSVANLVVSSVQGGADDFRIMDDAPRFPIEMFLTNLAKELGRVATRLQPELTG